MSLYEHIFKKKKKEKKRRKKTLKSSPSPRRGLKLQGICFSLSVRRCHVFVTSGVSERRASAMTNNRATE
jgi:hypothetical protein